MLFNNETRKMVSDAVQTQEKHLSWLKSLKTCMADGCASRQESDYCRDHGLEVKRTGMVEASGGHNLETYRIHKIRHQTTRGMPGR